MPYIKQEDRVRYYKVLAQMPTISNKGDLEYCIFMLMRQYVETREMRYTTLHDVTYAAQHCADEFRRRYLDTREDLARQQNGDVE